jgi:hypothetical protein
MTTQAEAIQNGMAVFARDGERLGTVVHVWPQGQQIRKELNSLPADGLRVPASEVTQTADPAITATMGNQRIEALGGLGGKGRGRDTDTTLAAHRGDPRALSGKDQGVEPQSGGMDVLRGYGMQRNDAGNAGAHPTSTVAGAYAQNGDLPAVTNVSETSSFEAGRAADFFMVEGTE